MLANLPSGLALTIRGLTGKDGRYLSNEKLVRDEEIEDYVFSHTLVEVVDEGPYSFEGKAVDWGKVLIGDRTHLALAIREATYPDEPYVVPLRCVNKMCRKPFEWEVDIARMLRDRTQHLSDAARETLKGDGRFEFEFPSTVPPRPKDLPKEVAGPRGRLAYFKLKTGADAKRYNALREHMKSSASKKRREEQNDLVDGFLFFGMEIAGIEKKDREGRQAFLEGLPMRDINALRNTIDATDCGVDTTIEVECPSCEVGWEIELPFGRELFAPSDPNRRAKRERRIQTDARGAADVEEK
jgi:hypothetical protein